MSADFLHGDMGKEERSNVLRRFRAGQLRTLVVSGASYLRAVSSNTTGVSLHGFCVCVCVCVCVHAPRMASCGPWWSSVCHSSMLSRCRGYAHSVRLSGLGVTHTQTERGQIWLVAGLSSQ